MATKTKTMVVNATSTPHQFQSNRRHNLSFDNAKAGQTTTYPSVRNMLAEQEQKPMNQTYTIGSNLRQSAAFRQQRSGSMDSDIPDCSYSKISSTIAGIFPRSFGGKAPCRKPAAQSQTISRMMSSQLPLIDGCSAERLCCQRPWTRTQYELSGFKKTLKEIN